MEKLLEKACDNMVLCNKFSYSHRL